MTDWFPKRMLGMLPAEAARRWGQREALVFNEQRWTYGQFAVEVDRVARALIAAGVESGEHVAMWVTNRPQFLFSFYAIIKVGGVAVPLNTRLRSMDLDYALRQSNCTSLIAVGHSGAIDYAQILGEVLGPVDTPVPGQISSAKCPGLKRMIMLDRANELPGAVPWDEFLAVESHIADSVLAARAAAVDPNGMAIIMYTSGTTGEPKGVMLSHVIIRVSLERAAIMGVTVADVQLNDLPLFHMYSLAYVALHSILTGATQVLTETFDPDLSLRLIAAERVATLFGFDTHYRDLIEAKKRQPSLDLSSLRLAHFTTGLKSAVPVAIEVQTELCPSVGGYSSTEAGSGFTQTPLDANLDQRTRASGYPLPDVELRVVDPETGVDVAVGTQGEILVRTYAYMLGYYNMPGATAEAINADGWMHTGDAGILREDGHLRFVGRYKDMLKVGGENVSPAEVEYLLLQVPGIAQVAVVGCPDPRLQEAVAAFVLPAPGVSVTLEAMDAYCRGKIDSYKIPRRLLIVDALPMTPSGKVQKHLLRQRLA